MNPQDAIDLGREAIRACFMVGGPILLASLIIGLLTGVLQAMTQVQDQTVSFVPKLLGTLVVLGLCLPWLSEKLVDFSSEALSKPMTHFHSFAPASPPTQTSAQPPLLRVADRSNGLPGFPVQPKTGAENRSSVFQLPTTDRKHQFDQHTDTSEPFTLPRAKVMRSPKTNIGG